MVPLGSIRADTPVLLTADAAPVIDGDALALVAGRVIFRTAEAAAAPRRLRRVSVGSDGAEANATSAAPAISADGRQVAFESAATNLAGSDDAHGVFVHALDSGVTSAVPLLEPRHDGGWPGVRVPPGAAARSPSLSGDGRYVAVSAPDELGRGQIWVTDRDTDGNGAFDEPDGVSTAIVSTDVRGRQPGERDSLFPFLTPGAELLTFLSAARNLQVDGAGVLRNMWQHWDPAADAILKSEQAENNGAAANSHSLRQPGPMTPNGEIAFASPANNLVAGDSNDFCLNPNGNSRCADVFVFTPLGVPLPMPADGSEHFGRSGFERVSLGNDGQQGNQQLSAPAISWDGRFVGFVSVASNLVPGDSNGTADVFAPATCSDGGTSLQRLLAPLGGRPGDGGQLFVGAGRCVEEIGTSCGSGADCAAGSSCELADTASGGRTCQRRHGTCRADADCAAGASCRRAAVVAAAADSDGDEVPGPYDNCPTTMNVDQEDSTGSGVGDACQGALLPASPTPFPTATRTPSGTATVTATLAATATTTATATVPGATATATRRRDDGGGCAIGGANGGPAATPVVLLVLALIGSRGLGTAMRRRRPPRARHREIP